MNSGNLLAIAFVGLFVICLASIAATVLIARFLTSQTTTEVVKPRRKIFRPAGASATPELTGKEEPAKDGITYVDKTETDGYKELHELPKGIAMEAVEAYLKGDGDGKEAIGAAVDEVEE